MIKKAIVPLADGLEEIEAITIIDILRRAKIEITTAGLTNNSILGSHNIKIESDTTIDKIDSDNFDIIVLPGGMPGTINLMNNQKVIQLIQDMNNSNKIIGAICAAPMVLYHAGILDNKKFTMHPGVIGKIPLSPLPDQIMEDGNIITGQASGAAVLFSLKLVEKICGSPVKQEVNKGVLYKLIDS